ncbi:hypothetical protein RRG08_036400 [Elysia crispata]|uniref:Uncharacterized protein n=1 Tax=Elysia crispata TaxID=231223 RepID=A0AAE0ZJU9_9GAST|nr:hypothetical protein RRG08_036400 [Elysia crispata]
MEQSAGSPSRAPSVQHVESSLNETTSARITVTVSHLRSLIDDKFYRDCKRHFLMVGKGRRPDLPILQTLTQRVLIQLYFIKEEGNSSFRELKLWLEKLDPSVCHVTEGRVKHKVTSAVQSCLKMTEEVALHFLSEHVNFHAALAALADLNLNRLHLTNIEPFTQPSLEFITNRVVIALEHFKSSERNISFSTVKWLKTLSTQCSQMSDSLLTSNVLTTIKKYKLLSKMKNANDLEDFLKKQFPEESNSIFAESSESSVNTTEMSEVITPQSCSQCDKLKNVTDAAIKKEEGLLDEKLGRDKSNTFSHFASSGETAAFRVIRTTSDVFGPRGDEKNGCREDWLAYCDTHEIKSQFTTYRSNRFNNIRFE